MTGFSWVDLFLGMGILIGVVSGFTQGLLRQIIALASMYIGAILATQYYTPVARTLKSSLTTTPGTVLQALAFFFILFLTSLLINGLAFDAYRNTKLRILAIFDNLAGAFVGAFNAWFLLSLLLLPVNYIVGADTWGTYDWIRQGLASGVRDSYIAAWLQTLFPYLVATIKPFLPPGFSTIFDL
ncbi:MAG TPA: CvpA family protein [Anaerolineae bacterium]